MLQDVLSFSRYGSGSEGGLPLLKPACLLAAVGLAYAAYQLFLSPLARYHGPLLAKVSRAWLAFHGYKGDLHSVLMDLHTRYGDVVRIGPNELSIISPDAVREIYGMYAHPSDLFHAC